MKLLVRAEYRRNSVEDGQFGAYFILDAENKNVCVISMEHYGQTGDDDFAARKKAEPVANFIVKALNHFDMAVEELRWSVDTIIQGGRRNMEEAEKVLASIDNPVA
jgi:hypothetical protein